MTDCEISTQTADSVLELRDEDATEVAKLVLKAPAFLGLLADIERSCDIIELHLSPEYPNVRIVTYGMQVNIYSFILNNATIHLAKISVRTIQKLF